EVAGDAILEVAVVAGLEAASLRAGFERPVDELLTVLLKSVLVAGAALGPHRQPHRQIELAVGDSLRRFEGLLAIAEFLNLVVERLHLIDGLARLHVLDVRSLEEAIEHVGGEVDDPLRVERRGGGEGGDEDLSGNGTKAHWGFSGVTKRQPGEKAGSLQGRSAKVRVRRGLRQVP